MIENALNAKLKACSGVTSLVGPRIYVLELPQDLTYPAITYFKMPSQRHNDIDIAMANIQIDGWTETYEEGQNLAENIRIAIQREKGVWSGVKVISVVLENEYIDRDPDIRIYHSINEYRIKYREI